MSLQADLDLPGRLAYLHCKEENSKQSLTLNCNVSSSYFSTLLKPKKRTFRLPGKSNFKPSSIFQHMKRKRRWGRTNPLHRRLVRLIKKMENR